MKYVIAGPKSQPQVEITLAHYLGEIVVMFNGHKVVGFTPNSKINRYCIDDSIAIQLGIVKDGSGYIGFL